jgi:hypothetical protein
MNDWSAIMTKQRKSTVLAFPAPLPVATPETGLVARFCAALASLGAFFTKPADVQEKEASRRPRKTRAQTSASGHQATQRKHLRIVHTGTRI